MSDTFRLLLGEPDPELARVIGECFGQLDVEVWRMTSKDWMEAPGDRSEAVGATLDFPLALFHGSVVSDYLGTRIITGRLVKYSTSDRPVTNVNQNEYWITERGVTTSHAFTKTEVQELIDWALGMTELLPSVLLPQRVYGRSLAVLCQAYLVGWAMSYGSPAAGSICHEAFVRMNSPNWQSHTQTPSLVTAEWVLCQTPRWWLTPIGLWMEEQAAPKSKAAEWLAERLRAENGGEIAQALVDLVAAIGGREDRFETAEQGVPPVDEITVARALLALTGPGSF